MLSVVKLLLCIGILLAAMPARAEFKLTSNAFKNGDPIPSKYTCQGDNISPHLSWSDAPKETERFALIVHDPDAPDPKAPKINWVHWIVLNMPADKHDLSKGILSTELRDLGAIECKNDFADGTQTKYGGPCPPIGEHRYFFKLYALKGTIECPTTKVSVDDFNTLIKNLTLASAELMGTYKKK